MGLVFPTAYDTRAYALILLKLKEKHELITREPLRRASSTLKYRGTFEDMFIAILG